MTKGELLGDLNDRISAAKVSGIWTDEMKINWLDNAGQRVCGFKPWTFLELALERDTVDSREYYDYPAGVNRFKPNSIYQITIEDESYDPGVQGRCRVNWQQFTKKKQEGDQELVFANHNGFYFLHPIPTNGKEMSLYGRKGWRKLSGLVDDDSPITPEEFDEAIVRLALAACLRKAKKYDQAKAEAMEVLDPNVGLLAMLWMEMEEDAAKGYGGEATSSRFDRG